MTRKIALITELAEPELSRSDELLVAPLHALGWQATAVPWDAPNVDWQSFDALVLRSCWLYHQQPDRFKAWIAWLAQQNAPLWNTAPVVTWNMDKLYLRDFAERGVAVPPTIWLESGTTAVLSAILDQHHWPQAVVKPCISASAHNTWQLSRPEAAQQQTRFQRMLHEQGLLVQQFLPEIAAGEWSLIFFGGEYSHGVLKKPATHSIYVQEHLGGCAQAAIPPETLVEQARFVIEQAMAITDTAVPPVYARVDGVVVNGRFTLMELELIEPDLFLQDHPTAAAHFAAVIAKARHGA